MPFGFFKKKNAVTPATPNAHPFYIDPDTRNITEFRGMEPNERSGFTWVGIHPDTPYIKHFIHVETRFQKRIYIDLTHHFFVGVENRRFTIPLYGRQAKMDAPGMTSDQVAAIVGSEMVRFLLYYRDPADVPGLTVQVGKGQDCPWSKVFQDARNKVIAQQLKKYDISVQAYLIDPDLYNAIKEPPRDRY